MPDHDLPLPRLYNDAEEGGIRVRATRFERRTALIRPDGLLAIDYSKIQTEADERAILLEEIGHFVTAAFYPPGAPESLWARQEHRASRFVFEKYYPPQMLAALMAAGDGEPWQLAEALGLPERFVQEMLRFYTQVLQIDFNALAATTKGDPSHTPSPISTPDLKQNPQPAPSPPPLAHPSKSQSERPASPLTLREQQMVRYWAAELLDQLDQALQSGSPALLHAADGSYLLTPEGQLLPAAIPSGPPPARQDSAHRAQEAESLLEDWYRRRG